MSIVGGRVLVGGGLEETGLVLEGATIVGLGAGAGGGRLVDARGLLVLPGIVDLHGDGFERQLQPRPGVGFPVGVALRDTEAQLLACGITTAFLAATLSWEPGLRSAGAWRALLDGLEARESVCDMRVHMRWEMHNLEAVDMAVEDVAAGRVGLVSFNDHTPTIVRKMGTAAGAAKYTERAMMGVEAFRALAEAALARGPEVKAGTMRLAAAARAAGVPMASHDDDTVATRARFRALGAAICEFPMAEAVGAEARTAGEAVVMGCPNVVRGGSHLGWASAAGLSERGVCTVLCSDYYYPAMAQAGLALGRGALGMAAGWALVSGNPAAAAGLGDRGVIAEGKRGDLVLVEPESGAVVMTIVAGEVAYVGREGFGRVG